MKAAIYAVPDRRVSVMELAALIEPSVSSLNVYWDAERRGNWWNHQRTLEAEVDTAGVGEPVLIMTDDVTTVPDWRERWTAMHEQAGGSIYCLFNRQRHHFKPDALERGFVKGCFPRSFYDQATVYIDQQGLIGRVLSWLDAGGRQHPRVVNRQRHLDVAIQEYLIEHRQPWVIATPTLFDHKPLKSTLGHAVGGSPCYIGS